MYKDVSPKIENTLFKARIDKKTNETKSYRIYPAVGYKLHEATLDENIVDEVMHAPTGEVKLGYTHSFVTAGASYNFNENSRQIYAVLDIEGEE